MKKLNSVNDVGRFLADDGEWYDCWIVNTSRTFVGERLLVQPDDMQYETDDTLEGRYAEPIWISARRFKNVGGGKGREND